MVCQGPNEAAGNNDCQENDLQVTEQISDANGKAEFLGEMN